MAINLHHTHAPFKGQISHRHTSLRLNEAQTMALAILLFVVLAVIGYAVYSHYSVNDSWSYSSMAANTILLNVTGRA